MNKNIVKRVVNEANYILKTGNTVRELAKIFNVSKSTVHKDLQERLLEINPMLHRNIIKVFEEHNKVRHLKGGAATKAKYSKV